MNDAYAGLLEKLKSESGWPKVYLFKFIIPNDHKKLAMAEALFGDEAQVSLNQSRTGKYTSVSGKELILSPDEVIARYRKASQIEGLIAL